MKLTKEFSDALGFKSLSTLSGFITDYPVEGATIQKIVDDGFTATCFKCYPIIANAGVDPTTYLPKNPVQNLIRNELRKQFPIKASSHKPELINVPESSDDELTSVKSVVQKPKPNPFTNRRPMPKKPEECTKCVEMRGRLIVKDGMIENLTRQLHQAQDQIKMLKNELNHYVNDPDFNTILEFQKMKRQRK